MRQNVIDRSILDLGPASRFEKSVATSTPLIASHLGSAPGLLEIVQGVGSIGFKLDGTLLWLTDITRFGGSPVLKVSGTRTTEVLVELRGALFPATTLPADYTCVIRPTGFLGTPMELSFTLGRFQAHCVMERWSATVLDSNCCFPVNWA